MKIKKFIKKEKKEKVNITYGDDNKEAKEVEIKEESKDMKRRLKKKFKLDLPVIIFIAVVALIAAVVLYLTIGNRGSKYGDRLRGINKISFTKKDKNKFVDSIKSNDKVNSASIDIQGKLIYIMLDVKKDVSIGDAEKIVNDSLSNLSDAVKGYYEINALITKKEEVPTEETKQDAEGKEKKIEHRVFPISGYKNNTSDHIVWESR